MVSPRLVDLPPGGVAPHGDLAAQVDGLGAARDRGVQRSQEETAGIVLVLLTTGVTPRVEVVTSGALHLAHRLPMQRQRGGVPANLVTVVLLHGLGRVALSMGQPAAASILDWNITMRSKWRIWPRNWTARSS